MPNSTEDVAWVSAQLALIAALILVPPGPRLSLLRRLRPLGLPCCVTGLLIATAAAVKLGRSLTPWPTPVKSGELNTRGLYRWVRHPIYSGGLLWAIGVALRSSGLCTLLACGLFGQVLRAKASHEERLLAEKYEGYATYAAATPRFWPRL